MKSENRKLKFISYLLNISFFILSFGQLARIALPDQPIFFYAFEPIVAIVTVVLVIRSWSDLRKSHIARMTAGFLGWMGVTLLVSTFRYPASDNGIAVLYFARLSMYLIFVVSLLIYTKKHPIQSSFRLGVGATTGWILFSSIVQYIWYPNLGNLAYLGWDPHLYRMVGLFFDPPLTVTVFVLIALYYALKHLSKKQLGVLIFIIPLIILSLLTYSRGGYLGILAIVGTFVIRKKSFKLFLISGAVALSLFILLPTSNSEGMNLLRTTSIEARVSDYDKAISIWKEHPIVGIGYNHIRPEKDEFETDTYYGPYNPSHGSASFHSSFLIILVTGGVIGLLLFGVLLVSLARFSPFMMYAVIFVSVISCFDNVLLHPFTLFLLGYLGSRNTVVRN